jgi:murein DD-endopeptidase MepM/ murein hydrolase activator NlpD
MNKRVAMITVLAVVAFVVPSLSLAENATSTAAAIQQQIDDNNAQIQQLDAEIAQFQTQLNATTQQKNTLQNTINQLTLQGKQLTAKITVTKSQIRTTQLQIQQLSGNITSTQSSINTENAGLGQSLQRFSILESQPIALLILTSGGLSSLWDDMQAQSSLENALQTETKQLASKKQTLTDTKTATEQKNTQLLAQQRTLQTQQGSLNATKKAQSDLLAQTKDQESTYQSMIAQKKAQEASFEEAINSLQAKLKAADTSKAPSPGNGILAWPLDNVTPVDCTTLRKIGVGQSCITQYFGNTAFSRTAAYNGQGHNGIDLRASVGTPVYAALGGVIWDTNYGVAPNCQYGKWVLIKHGNGLTTLYAHLSDINVSPGQSVSTGTLIGYSGQTGYATGPHLHFGVYNTSAVSFINYKCNSGPTVKVPVSPFNGYLNPLSYLPSN